MSGIFWMDLHWCACIFGTCGPENYSFSNLKILRFLSTTFFIIGCISHIHLLWIYVRKAVATASYFDVSFGYVFVQSVNTDRWLEVSW